MPLALAALALLAGCARGAAQKAYALQESYVGPDFFSKWEFWTAPDPANGAVTYVDGATAQAIGLATATADHVRLGSAQALLGGTGRRSVRIQSSAVYNQGLFVVQLDHIPTGCGTWPAFWMYGEDPGHEWPAWGEYDIIESVHAMRRTMTTLHTGPGCDQSSVDVGIDFASSWDVGTTGGEADNCYINADGQYPNQGCSQLGPIDSVGANFNSAGGGTFAAEWDPVAQHIRTWFWPAGLEPADVARNAPEPAGWGMPYSHFSLALQACAPYHFVNMRMVFNIDFCGDLGEEFFADHCPDVAEGTTCAEFVEQHPEDMLEAFWSIRKLDVYQKAEPSSPRRWILLGLIVILGSLAGLLGAATSAVGRRDLSYLPQCGRNDYDEVDSDAHPERELLADDGDPPCNLGDLGWVGRLFRHLGLMRRRCVVTL